MAKEKRDDLAQRVLARFQDMVANGPGMVESQDPWFTEFLPCTWVLLSSLIRPDGKPRSPARITIKVLAGEFRVVLWDEDSNTTCSGSGTQLIDALKAIEAHIASGRPMEPGWKRSRGR